MSDGTYKSMMKGCLGTFAKDVCARQCETALEKKAHGKASRWDERIFAAIQALPVTGIFQLLAVCQGIANEKKTWMRSKGYCR